MSWWSGEIDLAPIKHRGTEQEVSEWAKNLIGQEIKVVGKNGEEYTVGFVTGYLVKSILR